MDEYQEINEDSVLSEQLSELRSLEIKPNLDNSLCHVLDKVLEKLHSEDLLINNGLKNKLNFIEAAFLIQSASNVYSKEVDLLWDLTFKCQKRLGSYTIKTNTNENEEIQIKEYKFKQKSSVIKNTENKKVNRNTNKFHVDWEDVHEFQTLNFSRDSEYCSGWYNKDVTSNELQYTLKEYQIQNERCCHFRGINRGIYEGQDLVAYTSKLESEIFLEEILSQQIKLHDFSFELFVKLFLVSKFLLKNNITYDGLVNQQIEFEKFVSQIGDEHCLYDNNIGFSLTSSDSEDSIEKLRRFSVSSRVSRLSINQIYNKKCQVNIIRLSTENLKKLLRPSTDERKSLCEIEPIQKDYSSDHEFTERLIQAEGLDNQTLPVNNIQSNIKIDHDDCNLQTKRVVKSDDEISIPPKKKRKMSKSQLKKLAQGITVDLREFNQFFATHYNAEEGEGEVENIEFEMDNLIGTSSLIDPDEVPLSELSGILSNDSGIENPDTTEVSREISNSDSGICDISTTSNDINKELSVSETTESNTLNKEKSLHQKVYDWKKYINEKIKERPAFDFNIHEYGTKIMNSMEFEKPKKFSEIVAGRPSEDVACFFMTALQLANTSNLEIQGAQNGQLSNDTFALNLISKECYYDHLKDYQAPSEENIQNYLNKKGKRKQNFETVKKRARL